MATKESEDINNPVEKSEKIKSPENPVEKSETIMNGILSEISVEKGKFIKEFSNIRRKYSNINIQELKPETITASAEPEPTPDTSPDIDIQTYINKINEISDKAEKAENNKEIIEIHKTVIKEAKERAIEFLESRKQMINNINNNQMTIIEIITEPIFISTYMYKLLHYGSLLAAAFFAEKIFTSNYMQKVYANNSVPPSLYQMLFIFIALDIVFITLITAFLYMLILIFSTNEMTGFSGFVETYLNGNILMFVLDSFIFLAIFTLVMLIIVAFMQKKKYFRYKTEGLRAIRALREIMMYIALVLIAIPYFKMFGPSKPSGKYVNTKSIEAARKLKDLEDKVETSENAYKKAIKEGDTEKLNELREAKQKLDKELEKAIENNDKYLKMAIENKNININSKSNDE